MIGQTAMSFGANEIASRANSYEGYHSFKDYDTGQEYGRFEIFYEETTGWCWWPCFEGCIPESEASGPFDTSAEAYLDAQG